MVNVREYTVEKLREFQKKGWVDQTLVDHMGETSIFMVVFKDDEKHYQFEYHYSENHGLSSLDLGVGGLNMGKRNRNELEECYEVEQRPVFLWKRV